MRVTLRNLRAVLALTFTCVAITACSVMPFQGSSGRSVEPQDDDAYASEVTAEGAAPDGYERTGEGAPGNRVDSPGGERTGTAGATDAGKRVDETARGADVGKDGKQARVVF